MVLVVFETLLGIGLLVGYRLRQVLTAMLALTVFFTFLTFYSAFFNKVTDCGCFGDAIPLTPWTSFAKDVVLLGALVFLLKNRNHLRNRIGGLSSVAAGLGTIVPLILALMAIRHLPFIDFRAYKKGNNIQALMAPAVPCEYLYIMEKDGKEVRLNDYPSDPGYTFKEMKVVNEKACMPKITDYNLTGADGTDMTQESLTGNKLLVVVHNTAKSDRPSIIRLNKLLAGLEGVEPMLLTSDATLVEEYRHEVQLAIPYFFADATVLKTMIRSNPGLILLQDGTVLGKWHYNDIPDNPEKIHSLLRYD